MQKYFSLWTEFRLVGLMCLQELVIKAPETEISPVSQFMLRAWSGSRYSGLVCMALSSVIYFVMEVLSENFTG